jgi:membrane protease YdiL (CAAX protease family)
VSAPKTVGDRIAWLFLGPKGLRLPWSILILLFAAIATQITSIALLQAFGVHSEDLNADASALGAIKTESLALASIIVATLTMAVVERRPLDDYFLGGKKPVLRATQGMGVGLVLIALLVGVEIAVGALSFGGFAIQGPAALISGLEWALACVMIGLLEEMAIRGYLLARLARSFGFRWAASVTTVLFAAAHFTNLGEGLIGLVSVVIVGLVFCYAVWKTGSLWWAFGFHVAWDWGETYLFGTADSGVAANGNLIVTHPHGAEWLSGGPTGPEGSVLCFAALALAAACVHWLLPKRDAR